MTISRITKTSANAVGLTGVDNSGNAGEMVTPELNHLSAPKIISNKPLIINPFSVVNGEALYRKKDVLLIFDISKDTLMRWMRKGKIGYYKSGLGRTSVMFSQRHIDQFRRP